jgi:hypothetical protein
MQHSELIPPHVDGFQRALLLEQHAWHDALSATPRPVREHIAALAGDLYALLRTPIFPKGRYRAVAEALAGAASTENAPLDLHCVLASPTAEAEIGAFMECAAAFKRYGFAPRVTLLMVQWENLVDARCRDELSRARAFARQTWAVTEAARQAGFAGAVVPVRVEIDVESGEIAQPCDFRASWDLVVQALDAPRRAEPALARDLTWCTDFYARQHSLRQLGERQVLLDLAIRRAVGARVPAAHEAAPGRMPLLVTSELHKRFLPCYAADVPILNIDTRAWPARAAKSA